MEVMLGLGNRFPFMKPQPGHAPCLSSIVQSLQWWHHRGLWFGDIKSGNIVVDDSRRSEGIIVVYLIDVESYVVWSSGHVITISGIQVRGPLGLRHKFSWSHGAAPI